MTTLLSSIKHHVLVIFTLSVLAGCGGGGSGGSPTTNGGDVNSSIPNTKPQTPNASASSLAASGDGASDSSRSSRAGVSADLLPPTTPENFEVGLKIHDAIGLNWTYATDNIAVFSYKIYRDNVLIGDAGEVDSAFLDFDVAPDKNYVYSISAVDEVGNQSPVASVSVRTPPVPIYQGSSSSAAPDTTPPTVPGSLVTKTVYASKVDLEWTAGTDNSSVAFYKIYRDGVLQASVKADVLTFSDKSVTQNTLYSYAVETIDGAGNASPTRKQLSVTTPMVTTNGDITLYWGAPSLREDGTSLLTSELGGYIVRYKLKISSEFVSLYIPNGSANSHIIPNLVGDYEFEIAAYDQSNLQSVFVSLTPH